MFERFRGALAYTPDEPLSSTLTLSIDAAGVACHSPDLKPAALDTLSRFAAANALSCSRFPRIDLASTHFAAKPLRGYVAEANLLFCGNQYPLKANVGFGIPKNGRVQIDADASLSLTRLAIPRPTSLFGLVHTVDEIVLHALIWGVSESGLTSAVNHS